MAFKFALIIALCIAQGFASKPLGRVPGKEPCKKPISESAEEIPHEFEETMNEMDEVRETVSMAAVDAYFKGNDPDVIIACFREQKANYVKLGQEISGMMKKAASEMAEELGDDYEKYAKKAVEPMRNIAVTMKMLPKKMYVFIKNKQFGKAMEAMRESRRIVEENSKALAKILNEMAEENPEAAEKAENMAREIREAARNGCRTIGEAFKKCVEEGGPKNPIEDDDESELQLEEAPEQ